MKKHLNVHIGYRTVKTALAVTISLLLGSLFGTHSPIFAGIGAIVAMTRTFRDSLRQAATQYVGIMLGGVVGVALLLLSPVPTPWAIGLGSMAAIVLCNLFHADYAAATACIIVLSTCMGSDTVITDMLYRLLDTTIGLTVGVIINISIKPYNNRPRILALLRGLVDDVPSYVDTCILRGLYPDLAPYERNLRQLDTELEVYGRQRFFRKRSMPEDVAFLQGMFQLVTRMYQELAAICFMDSFGCPSAQNADRLRALGLDVPETPAHKCSLQDSAVTNYHLEKLLDARGFLQAMLDDDAPEAPTEPTIPTPSQPEAELPPEAAPSPDPAPQSAEIREENHS